MPSPAKASSRGIATVTLQQNPTRPATVFPVPTPDCVELLQSCAATRSGPPVGRSVGCSGSFEESGPKEQQTAADDLAE